MIVIEREAYSAQVFAEIVPLGQKCWAENTALKADTCAYYGERDFQIEPDAEQYESLNAQGSLVLITLRHKGILKGYVVGFPYRSLHHKKILCALGDTIYVEPAYRSYTAVIAEKFEHEMRALGVEIIGWPVSMDGPVYSVLKARGYVGDDIVMEKRLCAS